MQTPFRERLATRNGTGMSGPLVRILVVLVVVALVGTSCRGEELADPSGDEPTETDGQAEEAPPAPDGVDRDAVVRIAWAGPTPSMDPHRQPHTGGRMALFLFYDRLTRLSPDLEVEPMVATGWDMAADASYLEMRLRDDVAFHDGTPLTAEAVKASIERGQTLEDSAVSQELSTITSIEVVDDHTVRFHVSEGGPQLPAVFSDYAGIVLNPDVLDDPGADLDLQPDGAGSGAYLLAEFEPNELTVLERNPDHWDDDTGHVARVEIQFIAEGASRLAGLQSGQLDLVHVTGPDVVNAQRLRDEGAIQLVETHIVSSYALLIQATRPAMSDPRVREAIRLGIDKEALESISPDCQVATQPHQPGHWSYNDAIENPYDPDRARELMDETGPISFTMRVAAGSSFEPVAVVIQEQLTQLGMDVNIEAVSFDEAIQPFQAGEVDAVSQVMQPAVDPSETLNAYFLDGYRLADEDRDMIAAMASEALAPDLTQEQRAEIYGEIWRIAVEERSWYVPICHTVQGWAHTKDMLGLETLEHLRTGHLVPDRLAVVSG